MSRRLVAGLVALIAIGGVFAYGLSKQDDVSRIDTKHVTVPPSGFQTFAAAAIKGTTLDARPFSLARLRGQAGLHQLLGLVVRRPASARRPTCAASRTALGGRASFVGVAIHSPHGGCASASSARPAGATRS